MIHSAMAIPATASRPAATDPAFFVAAPVKLGPDPVFDGEIGTIGEPEAEPDPDPDPDPDPEPDPKPEAPVANGPDAPVPVPVAVAKPVAPATPLVLSLRISRRATMVDGVGHLTRQP